MLSITDVRPKIGIICGSGLGDLATQVENAVEFEYSKIPKFPVSTGESIDYFLQSTLFIVSCIACAARDGGEYV